MAATAAGTSSPAAGKSGQAVLIIHSGSITFCDQFDLHWQEIDYEDIHDWTSCGISSLSQDMGIKGKTRGIGENVILSDNYSGDEGAGYLVEYTVQLPLKSGNAFYQYTDDGNAITRDKVGYYTLGKRGEKHAGPGTREALRHGKNRK